MKKISDILRKKQVLYPLIALAGFVLGWLLFSPSSSPESAGGTHAEAHNHDMHGTSHDLVQDESGVWTCSMHPQIRQDKPGKCPICGMDLIPLKKNVISGGDAVSDPDAIRLSDEAMALADVQTTRVSRRQLMSADVLNGLTSSSPARPYVPGRHLLLFIRLNFSPPSRNCSKRSVCSNPLLCRLPARNSAFGT